MRGGGGGGENIVGMEGQSCFLSSPNSFRPIYIHIEYVHMYMGCALMHVSILMLGASVLKIHTHVRMLASTCVEWLHVYTCTCVCVCPRGVCGGRAVVE